MTKCYVITYEIDDHTYILRAYLSEQEANEVYKALNSFCYEYYANQSTSAFYKESIETRTKRHEEYKQKIHSLVPEFVISQSCTWDCTLHYFNLKTVDLV